MIRALFFFKNIRKLELFFKINELSWLLEKHPQYRDKFFRPYLHCSLSIENRVETIIEHFRTSLHLFQKDFLVQLFLDKGIDLGYVDGYNDSERYVIKIFHSGPLAREGEFTLGFFDSEVRLYSATFVLAAHENTTQMFLGGGIPRAK